MPGRRSYTNCTGLICPFECQSIPSTAKLDCRSSSHKLLAVPLGVSAAASAAANKQQAQRALAPIAARKTSSSTNRPFRLPAAIRTNRRSAVCDRSTPQEPADSLFGGSGCDAACKRRPNRKCAAPHQQEAVSRCWLSSGNDSSLGSACFTRVALSAAFAAGQECFWVGRHSFGSSKGLGQLWRPGLCT